MNLTYGMVVSRTSEVNNKKKFSFIIEQVCKLKWSVAVGW